ncbi:MAG: hypothetical protein K2W92_07120 [Alphaproteobacteria bacterium]|nr:hypothetical protein [Alphaproteobacteria bacterium]
MSIYTSNLSRILRNSAVITLFFLSSVATFAGGGPVDEEPSKTPSIQAKQAPISSPEKEGAPSSRSTPSPELETPEIESLGMPSPSTVPSVQAVDPFLEIQRRAEIARLERQIAEDEAAAAAAKLTAQQYTAPPPVDLGTALFGFLAGGRSEARIGHNVSTEMIRGKESFNNLLNGKGWKSERRLAKDEKKRLKRQEKRS